MRKSLAAALIAAKTKDPYEKIPEGLRQELHDIFVYNDACSSAKRIGWRDAIGVCKAYGISVGREGLNHICRKHFDRKSYAKA